MSYINYNFLLEGMSNIQSVGLPKYLNWDRKVCANSADPDQTAHQGAV